MQHNLEVTLFSFKRDKKFDTTFFLFQIPLFFTHTSPLPLLHINPALSLFLFSSRLSTSHPTHSIFLSLSHSPPLSARPSPLLTSPHHSSLSPPSPLRTRPPPTPLIHFLLFPIIPSNCFLSSQPSSQLSTPPDSPPSVHYTLSSSHRFIPVPLHSSSFYLLW